jgi:hypothetical protein
MRSYITTTLLQIGSIYRILFPSLTRFPESKFITSIPPGLLVRDDMHVSLAGVIPGIIERSLVDAEVRQRLLSLHRLTEAFRLYAD